MTSFLKGLRGNGEQPDPAQVEIREIASRIHGERQTLEQLVTIAHGSSMELGKLTEPITKLSGRLAALERQVSAIEKRVPAVSAVEQQAERILTAHQQLETQLDDSGGEVARIKSELGELGRLVESANGLKRDLAQFLEFEGPFRALKGEAEELKAWMTDLAASYGRLRDRQEDLARTSTEATSRLDAVERASHAAARSMEVHRRRVDETEQTLAGLAQLAAGASDTKRQLLTLKALADQVTQKVAALENQRDAVDRVAKDVSRLDDLVHKTDGAIREQEKQIFNLHTLTNEVNDIRSLYESVSARSEEISVHQQEAEAQERATSQKLADLSDQLRKATERFDLEHRGIETVSHRITDLRAAVKDCEERMTWLGASSRAMTEMQAKVEKIWNRVDFLMRDVETLKEMPERMRTFRADAHRLHELMQRMSARSAEIESAKPAVEAAVRDLAALGRTHESIKDALDQMRMAQDEIARARDSQVGTESWLKKVQEMVADLQERVQRVDAARPTVESVQNDVERVVGAMEVVASRRQFLDDMQARLAELAALGAQLDDRTKAFRSRLDIAEGRFVSVTKHAEEAERITNVVARVSGTVAQADDRVADLTRSITALEARSQNLEGIAERVRLLGRELEERQGALDKASAHLARASALREEAADAVQRLDERTRTLETTLDAVDNRTKRLEALSEELESCSGKLRSMEKGMAQFEGDLGRWETAKLELRRSLEQAASRQSTVDALQANMNQMFELAERTANDLKAAAEAQREIRESRGSLDDLLRRLHEADAAAAALELRKQDIEHAERRLARAEALLIDIQSSLEMLNNQKAMLDHVIEQAGSLTFQVQQGEALIDRLRKERDITNAVRSALDDSGIKSSRPRRDT